MTNFPGSSYSITIPGTSQGHSAYLRLGYPEATSDIEQTHYSNNDAPEATLFLPEKPGIVLQTPGTIAQYMENAVTVHKSGDALEVWLDGDKVVNSSYTFPEAGTYHEVTYAVGQSTSWDCTNSMEWKLGAATSVVLGLDQAVSVAASFSLGLDSAVDVSGAGFHVNIDECGYDIVYGEKRVRAWKSDDKIVRDTLTFAVSKGVAPALAAYDSIISKSIMLSNVLTAGGVGATAMVPGLKPAISADWEESVKTWSETNSALGATFEALLAVNHALYLLSSVAVYRASTKLETASPQINITDETGGSVKLSTGNSSITITNDAVVIAMGALSRISLTADSIVLSVGENSVISLTDTNFSLRVGGSNINVADGLLRADAEQLQVDLMDSFALNSGTQVAVNSGTQIMFNSIGRTTFTAGSSVEYLE